jgi:hypothetical protein
VAVNPRPLWDSRWIEWGTLLALILVVSSVLWRYGQQVRGQAERAAVQSTLGALRTALVLNHVHAALPGTDKASVSRRADSTLPNPFTLLQSPAANYAGEVPPALLQEVPPGRWVYDRGCTCIGYKPQDDAALGTAAGAQALWFVLHSDGAAPQLRPLQPYVWDGQVLE